MSMDLAEECRTWAISAKAASRELALASTEVKNRWLLASAERLLADEVAILAANARDVASAPDFGLSAASIDRLTLTPNRLHSAVEGLRQVASLPDPIGEVREGHTRPNGLQVLKIGVPLGVIFFLYESRPNVTVDAAALCIKSGNAVILRGGKEAQHTNRALHERLQAELPKQGLPTTAVQLVPTADREAVGHLLKLNEFIDLTIPRGGESLIRRVAVEATMPVLKHYLGNCHLYIDEGYPIDGALAIAANAKCQRPGVCNAIETVLLHRNWAETGLRPLAEHLMKLGVELRGCPITCSAVPGAIPATDDDYAAEFLDLILAVKVVSGWPEAVEHIARFGSGHTEAILTPSMAVARQFAARVDAAAIAINASTRFHDGFELGLGAEIGISTDKFHARGPCGLRELTSTKYLLTGDGHIRA